ncbi:MAG TPA: hypothetical protein VJ735_18120, partial [Actinomycetes bacterium]|nr:hypothetical protein [Actinomycetes bacterium]
TRDRPGERRLRDPRGILVRALSPRARGLRPSRRKGDRWVLVRRAPVRRVLIRWILVRRAPVR